MTSFPFWSQQQQQTWKEHDVVSFSFLPPFAEREREKERERENANPSDCKFLLIVEVVVFVTPT